MLIGRTRRRAFVAIGLLTAFSTVAAACGSDDDGASDTTAAAAETTAAAAETTAGGTETTAGGTDTTEGAAAAPTGDPVVIGLVTAETGPSASSYSPGSKSVAETWATWANEEQGGIGGRPVEVVTADSGGQAAQAQAAVQKLVEEDGAVAIVVNDTTSETAIADYTAAKGIPVIGGSTNAAAIWLAKPNYFMTSMTNPVSASSGMVAAKENGATNYSAAVCAEVPACAEAGKLYEALSSQIPGGGLPFAGIITASAAAPNYTAECLNLIQSGADWIQLGMSIAPGLRLANECVLQGYEGQFGASNQSWVGEQIQAAGDLKMGGSMNAFPWFADSPAAQTFRDAMEAGGAEGWESDASTGAWAALELFRKTMTTAPTTPADVMTAYQGIKDETLDGLLPAPLTFSATAPSPPIDCFWVIHFEGGEFSTVPPSSGESGNGMDDGLATTCFSPKLG